MSSSPSTSSNGSCRSNHTLKKASKAERAMMVDLRAAYNATNELQNAGAGATNTGNVMLGSTPPTLASIKFADLPVPVRHARAAPRPVTPYPPSIKSVHDGEHGHNVVQPSNVVLGSPRPKKGFQPMAL
ncbi:hypothetical protein D9619_006872 [Psilocybe cf. subviscida]|uniref:Uncharacterized protein n=1 Tax=Psilocybe cf. subviscida TaxID=2480587 RepID=A0A8H5B405_9AGAR|nr:hypothetical protein D9619_006872 [Psilocybe cf. subviscida]